MGRHWRAALWCLPACPLAAWANNAPLPDGMLGIILIFPAAILGLRLAAARLSEMSRRRKFVGRAGLFLAVLLTAAGTELALIPLLVLLAFGAYRSLQMMRCGKGIRRFGAGVAMLLFTALAIVNYFASLNYGWLSTIAVESDCVSVVSAVAGAEEKFKAATVLDANKNKIGEYGTLKQLEEQGDVLERRYLTSGRPRGYKLVLQLSDDPAVNEKQCFLYAMPTDYGEPPYWVPSLVRSLRRPARNARRSFAVDESGVIRARDLGGSRPVTRAEAEKWAPL
jgi:hypothetical protein